MHMSPITAAYDPPGPLGRGGWGFGYAVSKGALDRIAGLINGELRESAVVAFNVEPGAVAFEDPFMNAVFDPGGGDVRGGGRRGECLARHRTGGGQAADLRIHVPAICQVLDLLPEWKPTKPTCPPFVTAHEQERMRSAIVSRLGLEDRDARP